MDRIKVRRGIFGFAFAVALGAGQTGRAGDLGINILLSGQVAPGVYGQVQLGNEAPPPLVYAQPMLIEAQPAPPPPVYLHVPPEHARHWRRYCRAYNACNRPVYFIRSAEYAPGYVPGQPIHPGRSDEEHGRGHGHEEHGRGNGHDHGSDRQE